MIEPDVYQWMIALLRGFEELSELIVRFESAVGSEPECADMLFAIISAKKASDHGATLLRGRLRRA